MRLIERVQQRPPDRNIGPGYLLRWYVWPRNRLCNLYLHEFLRSDDDRALHDHPWMNCSLVLSGGYLEVLPAGKGLFRRGDPQVGGTPRWRPPGSVVARLPRSAHRLVVPPQGFGAAPTVTLFLTGPRVRSWGFWCPEASPAAKDGHGGWRHWQDFVAKHDRGAVGPGCE